MHRYLLQGPQGPRGFAGYPGSSGQKGNPGNTGKRGVEGTKGKRGFRGVNGESGQNGPRVSIPFAIACSMHHVMDVPVGVCIYREHKVPEGYLDHQGELDSR